MDFSTLNGNSLSSTSTEVVPTTNNAPLNLEKQNFLNLSKSSPSLTKVRVGLGWDTGQGTGFDLDASVFMLHNEKVQSAEDVIFYKHLDGQGVHHTGDNRTGAGEGDDEVIIVDLKSVSADVNKLVFVATIFEADVRRQTFGMVNNSFMRIVDDETDKEIARFELKDDFSTETAVIFGELVKENSSWLFHTLGEGKKADLNGLYSLYM